MKRFFLFVAALCCMGMMSVNALAEKVYVASIGLYFELDEENFSAKIVRDKSGSDNYSHLPSVMPIPYAITYNDKSYIVDVIGANAFASNTTVKEFKLPEGGLLTRIESQAFVESAVEKINIPSTVTEIPYSSFYKSALYNNDANYEDGILYIDGCLIAAKTSLEGEVTVNVGTRLIAGSAFTGCKNINHVTLPEGVTYIGCNAFNNCSALERINFPASLNFIGDNAFLNCKLREVYLKSPLTIGKMAFFATTPSIQTVVLPKGESTFEDYAFSGQPGITRINVYEKDPSNLHMGTGVFDDVDKEKCIVYVPHEMNGGSVSDFKATDEWSTFIIQSNNVCADGLFFELNDVTKKMTLTYELYDSYFNYCTLEENVDMVSNIHAIHALDELGYTLTSVGARAFEFASQITSITLPETVEHIGMMAFSDLNQMKEFTIPEKVNFIGEFAFSDCTGLEKITNLNPEPQDITGKSVFYNVKKTEVKLMVPPGSRTAYQLADTWGSFDIEEMPIRIGDLYYYLNDEDDYAEVTYQYELSEDNYAFLPEKTKLVIPSEVTYNEKTYDVRYINSGAFRNCDKIVWVVIPGSVIIVGSSAFHDCKKLYGVTIHEGVKSLEMSVFEGCSNLGEVSLPSTLKQIDNYAFKGCTNWMDLLVYNPVPVAISDKVFEDVDKSRVNLYIPYGSKDDYLAAEVWNELGKEDEEHHYIVEMSNGVQVGELYYIFDKVNMTATVTFAYFYAAGEEGSNYAGTYQIPSIVTYEEEEYTVTSIGDYAFWDCYCYEIEIPASVSSIGNYAFANVSSFGTLTVNNEIPIDIAGKHVFENCPQDVLFVPAGSAQAYKEAEGWKDFETIIEKGIKVGELYYHFDKDAKTAMVTYEKYDIYGDNYNSLPEELIIPEKVTYDEVEYTVTEIEQNAFLYSKSLKKVTLPATLEKIGDEAFYYCNELVSIDIPTGVTSIGEYAFSNCHIETINLPENLTSIGNGVFYECVSLTSITIPQNVTSIGDEAFFSCHSLSSITCYAVEPPVLGDDVFGNIDRENIPLYVRKASIDKYKAAEQWKDFLIEAASNMCGDHLFWEIKDGVLTITGYGDMWNWDDIKNYAPWYDYRLEITSVQLPDGLTSIGEYAFYYCISLESITIPAGVTNIGECAFLVCNALESINVAAENEHFSDIDGVLFNKSKTILLQYPEGKTEESYTVPDGVTEIGEGAFYRSGVKNIHLPEGVTVIGASAFHDSGLSTIDLPSTLTFIGPRAFNRIPLMTIDIPEGVTSIEEATFAECKLQSIHLPASLTSIGEFAFYSCAYLESIDIPAGVTSIDENAFMDCHGLKSVTCRAPEPPTLGEDVFYLVDCPKTPLYVPLAALDKYKSADQWKEFKIEPMETPIVIAGQKITPDMYNTMISGEGIEGDVFVTENGIFLNKGASIYMSDPSVPAIELTATDKVDKFIISGVDAQIFNSIVISGKAEVQFNGALPDGIEHDGPLSLKLGADVWWNTEHTIELTEGAQVKLILNGIESESQDSLTFYSKSEAIHTPVGASCDIHAGGNVDFFIYNENCPVGYNDRTFTLHNTAMVLPYGGSVTKEGVLDAAGEEMFALRLSSNAPFIQSGKAYPIELCGVTVSEGTADDILGDGKASYDAETNTLSLDGMEVYRSEYQALRVVKSSINVEVKGENEFIEHSIRPAIEVENGDLRIFGDKDAKLHIDNYKSVVIRGDRTGKYRVAFEGCNVSVFASSGYTALEADSLYIDAANVSIGSQYDIAWQSMNPNKNGGLVLKHAVLKEGVVNVSPKMLFEPVPQYKVTFQDKDGNEIETQYVFEGEDAVAPEAPAVEGYTFTGWDKEFDNVTSDLTVKAKYEINHYALTLVAGHGTIAITDESGEHSLNPDMIMHGTIVKLIVTADEGYQFTQWSDGNTDNPRTLVLTQDTSLVAHFEIIYLQPDTVTLCYGETYQWHDKTYDASGVYIDTISSGVATLYLTILPQVEETIEEATICSGETYTWQADGKEYAESGTYSVTLQDMNGCDSVVILHLTVNPIATTEEHVTACDSYTWNGETYTQSGDYTYTTVAANGCDSIVTLHLTINNSEIGATEYVTICYGETYTWNGQTYSTEGEYSVTLSNTLGCDSVATLHLTIMPEAVTTTETVVIGSDELPYTWRGNTYSATGQYTVVEQYTTVACDSAIHKLDLTVLTTGNHDEQSVTICETEAPYTWYGESYSATGKYTYTEKYVGTDIDSIQHILNLTVNPTVYTEEHITACDSYEWNGQTYTESGEYVYTTVAANGCDSIVTLHLTINQSEHVEFSMTACDSYEWHGMTYTISGDYTYNTTTDQGCERVEVLHLTINKSEYVEESVTACDSYEWHGMTYTISGDYTYTTTTDQGCERVEVLHLTILPDATTESEELALCPSELPYEWYGQWLTEAGSYTATEPYAGMECDSIIHELTVNVYVQTLPAAVTLPIVRTGEAIDVSIPTAEIQAHIAAETWYAPNAEVAWYIMENSDWAALTTEPIAAGTTQIVLKYAVATDCGNIESDNMVIDVIPTSVENTHTQSPTSDCQKILYEDHIYILREGKMYNAQGQKVQ